MPIIFSEGSGVADSIYGKNQNPIKMFLEKRGEQFEQNSVLKDLFCMETSENYGDEYHTMTAMDGFDPVGENGAYPSDTYKEGFSKFVKYETWKDSFSISQEMIEDAKLMDMKKKPEAFMVAYERTREKFGASLYGAAIKKAANHKYRGVVFDATAADKKPLFATDHPSVVKGAAQTNCFSDAFSIDVLNEMETRMQLFRGDDDNILDVAPDTILIPAVASLKKDVFAAIGADKDPTTANNAFNYQFGRWNVICWPYLNQFITAGSKPFILLDSKYMETYRAAVWTDRVKLAVRSTIDENTDANVWRGRSRFSAIFNDWRFAAAGGITGGTQLISG